MADSRFFTKAGPFSLKELADLLGAQLQNAPDPAKQLTDVAALDKAGKTDLSFLDNKKYAGQFEVSNAGAIIVEPAYVDRAPKGAALLVTTLPYRGFALASQAFYPEPVAEPGVHPAATVSESAEIGAGCRIDAGAVIGDNVRIGENCHIGANAVIDRGVEIGAGCRVGATAYLGYCTIGRLANIHPGVRIGTRGFGFAMDQSGTVDVPQLGRVIVGDGVEIGANTAIDRGMGPDTLIGDGTKIDNLVQIGHNVQIGKGCVLVAMTGIAGSAVLEDYVVCAAQCGIAGHIRIGMGAQVGAKAGVIQDVPPGTKVGGVPAIPLKQWLRQHIWLNKKLNEKSK